MEINCQNILSMLLSKGIQDYYLFSRFYFVHVFLYFRNGTDVYLQWDANMLLSFLCDTWIRHIFPQNAKIQLNFSVCNNIDNLPDVFPILRIHDCNDNSRIIHDYRLLYIFHISFTGDFPRTLLWVCILCNNVYSICP